MVVVPLVFATLVAGAASITDIAKLGRVAVKTLLCFVVFTVLGTAIGLLMGDIFQPAPASTFPWTTSRPRSTRRQASARC